MSTMLRCTVASCFFVLFLVLFLSFSSLRLFAEYRSIQKSLLPSQNYSLYHPIELEEPLKTETRNSLSRSFYERNPAGSSKRPQYASFSIDKPFMTPALFDRYKGSVGVDYSGCQKGSSFGIDDVYPVNGTSIDITLITAGAMNRLVLFPIIASRWSGPILFVLHVKEEEEATLQSTLRSPDYTTLCQPRITLLVYLSSATAFFHSNYPINILRNLGIRHCRTTHFLLLDTDMLVSKDAYPTLMKLRDSLLLDAKVALVMPAFFSLNWKLPDLPLEQQLQAMAKEAPFSAKDLDQCFKRKACLPRKKGLFTHYYNTNFSIVFDLRRENKQQYYEYDCWPNRYQEPYLVVRRNDSIVLFNEVLINYGHNKITYVENLRFHGYRFVLAGRCFIFDIPHTKSDYQKQHTIERTNANWQAKTTYLRHLYVESLKRNDVMTLCDKSNPY
ncbi:glycosyltransferase-like protein LARGE2-like protein [Blastocystis sp. ATCC 50177/Nand II]|uniref:Glycosyltransferase-like protein LARGE2-like protein n=1 Tax=Blastocystis sp. subtype 1 (strain ATCC 50177 / NandII) TaxID=478820 RepID=A0A196S9M3_BLAHN|nr:glycosyltransferase-like protein LARGE2-like protein [Blastocystis sp. ATCC 50177/Nand II]